MLKTSTNGRTTRRFRPILLCAAATLALAAHAWGWLAPRALAVQAPSCAAPAPGMVSWYRAENNANDSQGTNQGTLQNGATFAAGRVGQGFNFIAANQSVQVPDNSSLDLTSQVTLEAWIAPSQFGTGNGSGPTTTIISKEGPSPDTGNVAGYSLRYREDGRILFRTCRGSVFNPICAETINDAALPLNAFSHVAGTYDGQTVRLYVNGVLQSFPQSYDSPQPIGVNNSPLTIGGTNYFGVIDESSINNRALSTAEIQSIFNAGSAGKCVAICAAAPDNQVSWYRAESNAEDSKGPHDGSFTGAYAAGKVGQSFNIADNKVVGVPDSATHDFTNAFTIEMWVNPSAAGTSDGRTSFISKGNLNFVSTQSYGILFDQNRQVFNRVGNGSAIDQAASASQLPLNTFSHVATTYDGTTLRVYVNGVLETSQATSIGTLANTSEGVIIGGANFSGVVMGAQAAIDETSLYNRALSPTEIQAIFNAGSAGKCVVPETEAGELVIGEFRLSGPNGPADEFFELYNSTAQPITVAPPDGSSGFALAASDGATRCVIPAGTVIPARGHFLCANGATGGYSLTAYAAPDATYTADVPDNTGVALFRTSNPAGFNASNRLDAAGSNASPELYREGAGLPTLTSFVSEHSFVRDNCGKQGSVSAFGVCPSGGLPVDTNNNANDFYFVNTQGTNVGAGQRLGAPGPENLSSPVQRNSSLVGTLLDATKSSAQSPNRVRDFTSDPANNSQFGTLSIRRRIINNTGAAVTRLRFRVVDITTFPAPSGIADLRVRTSTDVSVSGVDDSGTCAAEGFAAGCTVTVRGTVLEQAPGQPDGGGFNSSLSASAVTSAPAGSGGADAGVGEDSRAAGGGPLTSDTINLRIPLANGASINVQFLLGIQQTGSFRFYVNVEALP